MFDKRIFHRYIFLMAFVLAGLSGTAQAAIVFGQLPPPPPNAKLRVFVLPLTEGSGPGGRWLVPHEDYARNMAQLTEKYLDKTGIYEVVPETEIRYILGDQSVADWQWRRSDYALAGKAGRSLHADFIMILDRSYVLHLKWKMRLVHPETGNFYEVSDYLPMMRQGGDTIQDLYKRIIMTSYRKIFHEAKRDMLATAVRKGRITRPLPPSQEMPATPPVMQPERAKAPSAPDDAPPQPRPEAATPAVSEPAAVETGGDKTGTVPREGTAAAGKARLVVYDFEASEGLEVAALILAESLREELLKHGHLTLVNRENMVQALEELKLQQSALVDEANVIRTGRWLAASEAVTGRFSVLGAICLLQAKLTDLKTMGTLAMRSLKCRIGREEELLDGMVELADQLSKAAAR
ncbi:MAG: hypothetical protein JW950_01435 [Deltaproteobacteria bacterium]|nr:hypothetical protein [Deltaproteobacteria bacterium]